jgi:hypothetical protein
VTITHALFFHSLGGRRRNRLPKMLAEDSGWLLAATIFLFFSSCSSILSLHVPAYLINVMIHNVLDESSKNKLTHFEKKQNKLTHFEKTKQIDPFRKKAKQIDRQFFLSIG